jgi:hypothetical protein
LELTAIKGLRVRRLQADGPRKRPTTAQRDGLVQDGLADQVLLIVTWLAVTLGVDEAVLAERLNR